MISDKEFEEGQERGRIRLLTVPRAVSAHFDATTGMITVELNRGFSISFHKERSQTLHRATDEQLSEIEIQGSGLYIIFPKLDDGLLVEGILAGRFGTRRWEREWADAHGIRVVENAAPEHTVAA